MFLNLTFCFQQSSLLFFFFGCAGSSLLHRLFSSCGKRGYSLVRVQGFLIAVASLMEYRV